MFCLSRPIGITSARGIFLYGIGFGILVSSFQLCFAAVRIGSSFEALRNYRIGAEVADTSNEPSAKSREGIFWLLIPGNRPLILEMGGAIDHRRSATTFGMLPRNLGLASEAIDHRRSATEPAAHRAKAVA